MFYIHHGPGEIAEVKAFFDVYPVLDLLRCQCFSFVGGEIERTLTSKEFLGNGGDYLI